MPAWHALASFCCTGRLILATGAFLTLFAAVSSLPHLSRLFAVKYSSAISASWFLPFYAPLRHSIAGTSSACASHTRRNLYTLRASAACTTHCGFSPSSPPRTVATVSLFTAWPHTTYPTCHRASRLRAAAAPVLLSRYLYMLLPTMDVGGLFLVYALSRRLSPALALATPLPLRASAVTRQRTRFLFSRRHCACARVRAFVYPAHLSGVSYLIRHALVMYHGPFTYNAYPAVYPAA